MQDADEVDHRERVLRRGPHHHGVAHRERGPELARHVDDREVVRRDARDRADRLAARDRAHEPAGRERGGRHLLRRQRDHGRVEREPRVRLEARPHASAPASACRRSSVQPVSAITIGSRSLKRRLDRRRRPSPAARRAPRAWSATTRGTPPARRGPRRAPAPADASGATPDDLFGGGVHDVVAAVGPVDPLAADQQLPVGHGGEV